MSLRCGFGIGRWELMRRGEGKTDREAERERGRERQTERKE